MRIAPPEFTIRSSDLTMVGFCRSGSRAYFRHHDMDWTDFLTNGVSSVKLFEMNDALADRLIEAARKARGI